MAFPNFYGPQTHPICFGKIITKTRVFQNHQLLPVNSKRAEGAIHHINSTDSHPDYPDDPLIQIYIYIYRPKTSAIYPSSSAKNILTPPPNHGWWFHGHLINSKRKKTKKTCFFSQFQDWHLNFSPSRNHHITTCPKTRNLNSMKLRDTLSSTFSSSLSSATTCGRNGINQSWKELPYPDAQSGFAIITWNNPKNWEKPYITKGLYLSIFRVDFPM